jgi:hypothetical protein
MATLIKGDVLFVHIPKTGGSWVRHVLRRQGLVVMEWPHPHPDMTRILNFPRMYPMHFIKQSLKHRSLTLYEKIRDSYKFCFVRNPFSWYESRWRFMKSLDWKSFHEQYKTEFPHILKTPWHPNEYLESIGPADFDTFMRAVIDRYPGYLTQMYGWYAPPQDIDFVGRTENLVDDLIHVLRHVGTSFDEQAIRDTGRINTSPKRVNKPEWGPDIRQAVRRLEAPIFEHFGYED